LNIFEKLLLSNGPGVFAYEESAAYQRTLFRCLFRGRCLETNVVSELLASNGYFSGFTVLALSQLPQNLQKV
jgi:hypothetical protein